MWISLSRQRAPERRHPALPGHCSTRADVATHSGPADAWMIIGGKVIDVSKYLEDHPGGEEVLLDRVGQDATEDFEDVGHSQDARKQLATFEVGELPPSERAESGADALRKSSPGAI